MNIPAGGYNSLTLENIEPLMNELTSVDHKNITATFHQLLSSKDHFFMDVTEAIKPFKLYGCRQC